jgi:ribosomal protein S13
MLILYPLLGSRPSIGKDLALEVRSQMRLHLPLHRPSSSLRHPRHRINLPLSIRGQSRRLTGQHHEGSSKFQKI